MDCEHDKVCVCDVEHDLLPVLELMADNVELIEDEKLTLGGESVNV
jgi:hypothetical protein